MSSSELWKEAPDCKPYALIDSLDHVPGYIGVTDRPDELDRPATATRLIEHRYDAKHGLGSQLKQTWLSGLVSAGGDVWIMRLPSAVPTWLMERLPPLTDATGQQVEETPAGKLERFWIWFYRELGYRLVNEAAGGPGQWGTQHSEETRAKIGESQAARHARQKLEQES